MEYCTLNYKEAVKIMKKLIKKENNVWVKGDDDALLEEYSTD